MSEIPTKKLKKNVRTGLFRARSKNIIIRSTSKNTPKRGVSCSLVSGGFKWTIPARAAILVNTPSLSSILLARCYVHCTISPQKRPVGQFPRQFTGIFKGRSRRGIYLITVLDYRISFTLSSRSHFSLVSLFRIR